MGFLFGILTQFHLHVNFSDPTFLDFIEEWPLEKIEQALKESKEQFGEKEKIIKKNVDSLIKVYSSMKAPEAAKLIAAIDEDLALRIISGMKDKVAGQVLSQLDVKVAKAITEKLAGKKETKPKKQP